MRFLPLARILAAVFFLAFVGVRSARMYRRKIRSDQRFQPGPHYWVPDFDEDVRGFLPELPAQGAVGLISTDPYGVRRGARLIVFAYALKPLKILRDERAFEADHIFISERFVAYDHAKLEGYELVRRSERFRLSLYKRREVP